MKKIFVRTWPLLLLVIPVGVVYIFAAEYLFLTGQLVAVIMFPCLIWAQGKRGWQYSAVGMLMFGLLGVTVGKNVAELIAPAYASEFNIRIDIIFYWAICAVCMAVLGALIGGYFGRTKSH